MYNLGVCYQDGVGVKKDGAKAVEWYRKAADLGDPHAPLNIGYCYWKGVGVEKDETEAFNWMKKGAEQSDLPPESAAAAEYNLGIFYLNGTGIKKDKDEALKHFKKAMELSPDILSPEDFEALKKEMER